MQRSTYSISDRSAKVIADTIMTTHARSTVQASEREDLMTEQFKRQEHKRLVTRADQHHMSRRNLAGVDTNLRRRQTPDLTKTIRMMDEFLGREEHRKASMLERCRKMPKPAKRPYSQVLCGSHSAVGSWTSKCIEQYNLAGCDGQPQPRLRRRRSSRGFSETMPLQRHSVPLPILKQPTAFGNTTRGFERGTWSQIKSRTASTFVAAKRVMACGNLEFQFEKLASRTGFTARKIVQLFHVYTTVSQKQQPGSEGLALAFGITQEVLFRIVDVVSTSPDSLARKSFAQFVLRLRFYVNASRKQQAKIMFKILDESGDSLISRMELLRFFVGGMQGSKEDKKLISVTVNEIMELVDSDGSGEISHFEFFTNVSSDDQIWWLFSNISPVTNFLEALGLIEGTSESRSTRAMGARQLFQTLLTTLSDQSS